LGQWLQRLGQVIQVAQDIASITLFGFGEGVADFGSKTCQFYIAFFGVRLGFQSVFNEPAKQQHGAIVFPFLFLSLLRQNLCFLGFYGCHSFLVLGHLFLKFR